MSDQNLRQFGEAVIPLGKAVRSFSLEQGNLKEVMFLKNLQHAIWVYKDIFRTTMWAVKTVAVECLDHHTLRLPGDCERLVNISVVDHRGKQHPLTCDPDLNTAKFNCNHKCSCKKCNGQNTLCAMLDDVTTTYTPVVIQGVTYQQTTSIRADSAGNIQQWTNTPVLQAGTTSVQYIQETTTICNVEVDDKGCIMATAPNMEALMGYFGLGLYDPGCESYGWLDNSAYRELIPANYNFWGYYNRNAADPDIIHIFRNDYKPHHHQEGGFWEKEERIGTVLVTYQTNGETPGEEVLVPEYAYDCLISGIIYRQHKLNPRDGDRGNEFYRMYRAEKMAMMRHQNPVRMDDLEKLQTRLRRW
jgi:hypothetical protein